MRISRIHTPQSLTPDSSLTLAPAQSHYIGTVLRLTPGSELLLFNGDGHEYSARLEQVSKKQASVRVLERHSPGTESTLHSHLGLVISRGERMDYAVQKSTELGVSRITPLFSERCEVRLKGDRVGKRQEHWQQVAISACEQSGRVCIPEVARPMDLADWLQSVQSSARLVCDHRQTRQITELERSREVALLIGPEGGFAEAEIQLARQRDFTGIALGPRVLRTETAPVAVLAVLQYLWGDLEGGESGK